MRSLVLANIVGNSWWNLKCLNNSIHALSLESLNPDICGSTICN